MKVHNDIMLSLNSSDNVVLVLLNYTSAFDTVNHNLLLSRLKSVFGIAGSVLKLSKSYLCYRAQFSSVKQSPSTSLDLLIGVPLGSVVPISD